jgi:hypothetical protein
MSEQYGVIKKSQASSPLVFDTKIFSTWEEAKRRAETCVHVLSYYTAYPFRVTDNE